MALRVDHVEHLHKVLGELEAQPDGEELLEKLEQQFKYLNNYNPGRFDVHLGYDWAKWSFSLLWTLRKTDEAYMNGGLIYHPGARGEADDSLSVELVPGREPHWSVHT